MNSSSSLSDLQDIAVPSDPAMWPPASGFWILLAVVLILAAAVGWRYYAGWKRNAYRRAGMHLLQHAVSVYDISVLLKRVAMAGFTRERVASLHGREWVDFLEDTGPGSGFADLISDEMEIPAGEALKASAGEWIRRHRAGKTRKSETRG